MRSRGRWLIGGVALVVVALAVLAAVSWHYSSDVLVPDHSPWPAEIGVEAVTQDRIVLAREGGSARPGTYGIEWQGGRAIVGPVLGGDAGSVTRGLRDVRGYLAAGMDVAIDADVWAGNPRQALGVPSSTVAVRGELGPMPAWSVAGDSPTWAIVVHGINDTPQVGLRIVRALRGGGLPMLLITYREDLGAPPSPDGFHHMGQTEWRDLEAAARHALHQGARRLVLIGYSMGGTLITQFMQHSRLAPRVSGLVLDAPALDWQRILEFNATRFGYPGFSALPVKWAIGARIDADWSDLNALEHTDALNLPILLFHGTEDDVVPIETSDDLAAALPRRVTYHRVSEAEHTQSWNVDPQLYERRLRGFLARPSVAGLEQ